MEKKLLLVIAGVLALTATVYAMDLSQYTVKGGHAESGIECIDCHGTDTPAKRAPVSACKDCHGDNNDGDASSYKDQSGGSYRVNIHDSHNGVIRCTLCHMSHEPSKLYCNEGCHHAFILDVP